MPSASPIKLPYRAHWNINNCCNVIIPLACNGGLRQLGNEVRQWRQRRFQRASTLSKLFTEPFNIFGDHGLNRSWQVILFFTPAPASAPSAVMKFHYSGKVWWHTREKVGAKVLPQLKPILSHSSSRNAGLQLFAIVALFKNAQLLGAMMLVK